jgi:hypothetical protein
LTHEKFHGSTGKVSRTTMKYLALSNFPYYCEMFHGSTGSCSWLFFSRSTMKSTWNISRTYGKMFMLFPFMHNIKTMKNFPYVGDVFHGFSEVFMVVREKKAWTISSYVRKSLLHFIIYHENVQTFWDSVCRSSFVQEERMVSRNCVEIRP